MIVLCPVDQRECRCDRTSMHCPAANPERPDWIDELVNESLERGKGW